MSTSKDVDLSDCLQTGDWLIDMMNEPEPTVTPIPHQLRCPKCGSADVACSRSNKNRTHTHRCNACGHVAVFGLAQ